MLHARRARTPIGVDVGGRHFKAVQLARSGSAWRIVAAAVLPRADDDVGPDEVRRLREALAGGAFRGRRVVLAVPGEKLLTGIMSLPPRSSGAPIEQFARAELSRMHRCDPGSFEMACWDLPAPARAGDATYVMAAACTHDDANALLDVFEGAGFEVEGLETASAAAARACRAMLADVTGIAGILDVGWNSARFVLMYRGVIVYERKLGKGGLAPLAARLADKLDMDAGAAEKLLVGGAPEAPDGFRAAVRDHFCATIEEMHVPLSYLANQYPDAPAERLLLVGEGARIPGLRDYLAESLQLEVRVVRPSDLAQCPPAVDRDYGAALTVAVGLGQFGRA